MTKLDKIIAIHQEVIHGEHPGHHGRCEGEAREFPLQDIQPRYDPSCEVCQEERLIAKCSISNAKLICSECFDNN